MRRLLRPFLGLLLALTLAAGSVAEGLARGGDAARAGLIEMVICSAMGEARITLDAEGNPVEAPAHAHCPDCLILADADLAAPVPAPRPVRVAAGRVLPRGRPLPALRRSIAQRARAPPDGA